MPLAGDAGDTFLWLPGFLHFMPQRNRQEYLDYQRAWRRDNQAHTKHRNRAKRELWEKWLIERGYHVCERCGTDFAHCFAVIEFHHTDPKQKEFKISSKLHLAFTDRNKARMLSEIQKTLHVCANCHRIIHHSEQFKREK